MRRLILLALAALVLGAGVWLLLTRREGGGLELGAASMPADDVGAAGTGGDRRPQPARAAEPLAGSDTDPARIAVGGGGNGPASGTLVVHVAWQDDHSPAADLLVLVAAVRRARTWEELEVRTDATGTARLTGLAPGSWRARVLHGLEATVEVKADETREVEILIPAGITVAGVVVDVRGTPVAQARVLLSERWDPRSARVAAVADDTGAFRLRALTRDHYVSARAEGYAPSCSQVLAGGVGDTVTVRLTLPARGGSVRGVVLDRSGQPVAGAALLVGPEAGGPQVRREDGVPLPGAPAQRLRSGSDGRFVAVGLSAGETTVQARAPGHAPWRGSVLVPLEATAELRIDLAPGAVLTGVVRADERPVDGAMVAAGSFPSFAASSTSSDAEGRYRLTDLSAGETPVAAWARNNARDETRLVLGIGTLHEWNPVLHVGLEIRGRVIDSNGAPLAGWRVSAVRESESGSTSYGGTTQREDGGFAIAVPQDDSYRVMVLEPGDWRRFPRALQDGVRPGADALLLQVPALAATAATVVGTLLVDGNLPLVDPELQVWHDRLRLWRALELPRGGGPFELTGIPPGTLSLEVRDRNHPSVHLGERNASAGAQLDLGTVRLLDPGFVAGTVTRRDGQPPGELQWTLGGADRRSSGVITMTGATFRSGPLSPGRHTLSVQGDYVAMATREVTVRAGEDTRVDLELQPALLRRLRITAAPGSELPRWVWVGVLDEHQVVAWARTLNRGRDPAFAAAISVPAGTYQIVVHRDQGRLAETIAVFAPGTGEDVIELVLPAGR